MDEWHPVNSIRNKNLSPSIDFDKKVGLLNHFISKSYPKISNLSIKRKIIKPTFHYEANTAKPKSFIKRKISKHKLPLKRKRPQHKKPTRGKPLLPKNPIRRQSTGLTSNALFRVIFGFHFVN